MRPRVRPVIDSLVDTVLCAELGREELSGERFVDETAAIITTLLKKYHDREDYAVVVPKELLQQAERTRAMFNILLVVIAATAIVQLALIYVPFLQPIFETTALAPQELALVLLVTPVPFIAVEIEKWVARRRDGAR